MDYAQERADLIGDASKNDLCFVHFSEFLSTPPKDLDSMSTEQILDKAAKKQEESVKAVDRIIEQVGNTKNLAIETAGKMHEQTEQLNQAEEGMKEIDDNLKEAAKLIRSFARRTMTDKLVLIFISIITAAVIFIIVWSILKKPLSPDRPEDFSG